jgi:cell division inhibitor SulA
MLLDSLLNQRPDLWRGSAVPAEVPLGTPTGFAALDGLLPWRGWPPGSLIEILDDRPGGGLALVRPALAALSRGAHWLLLVDPPFLPYAPALAAAGVDLSRLAVVETAGETAWAAEQALRSGACAAVLAWGGRWSALALRRLQLAAHTGGALALLFRPETAAQAHSPAVLRLRVRPAPAGMIVEVFKQRGGRTGAALVLSLSSAVKASTSSSLTAGTH